MDSSQAEAVGMHSGAARLVSRRLRNERASRALLQLQAHAHQRGGDAEGRSGAARLFRTAGAASGGAACLISTAALIS